MNMEDFSVENRERCEAATGFNHTLNSWSLSDWMTATLGELGEAANVAKKLNRVRDGIPGNTESPEELRAQLADELADTFIYLDLLAQSANINLAFAVKDKFRRTSRKIGYKMPALEPVVVTGRVLQQVGGERLRQRKRKGYHAAHDDTHRGGEIARHAAALALLAAQAVAAGSDASPSILEREACIVGLAARAVAPWPASLHAKAADLPRQLLIQAAALLVAEIERLDRAVGQ